jgi:hypothetical protein
MPRVPSAAQSRSILSLVRRCVPPEVAAASQGINQEQFEALMRARPASAFQKAVLEAQAQCEIELIAHIRSGLDGWQAAAWIAERLFEARWLRKSVFAKPEPTQETPFSELDENVTPIRPGVGTRKRG